MSRVAELESAAETIAYRQHRRRIWQAIRSWYVEATADAMVRGIEQGDARKAAARAVRGDMRALMSELLTRAPVPAVLGFLTSGLDWGEAGERIFEQGDAVVELIECAYPQPTWTELEVLDPDAAADDTRWSAWSQAWVQALHNTGPAARAALGEQPPAPVTPANSELSALRRWAPWLASAAAVVSVTAAVAVATKE